MANPKQVYRRNSEWWNHVERALVTDVLVHGQIRTTLERAKKIKSKVDKMNTLATRRQAVKYLINVPSKDAKKDIVQYLFDTLAPKYKTRNGGYTRIIKVENRNGDNAKMAIIQLV